MEWLPEFRETGEHFNELRKAGGMRFHGSIDSSIITTSTSHAPSSDDEYFCFWEAWRRKCLKCHPDKQPEGAKIGCWGVQSIFVIFGICLQEEFQNFL